MINTKTKICPRCGKIIWQLSNFCKSCSHKGINHTNKNNPNYKDGRTKKKYFCPDCGRQLSSYQAKRCRSCASKKQLRIKDHLSKYRTMSFPGISRPGKLNPNWKGGISFEPYPLGWNKTFKEQIRYRDGYRCQNCGIPEIECDRKLHVHHIDYNKNNLNLDNLISLCHNCHAKTIVTNLNKKLVWINYYKEKISDFRENL
ncbi:MAG: HNH endonuclease [Candidatus Helarchaeota archaeon]